MEPEAPPPASGGKIYASIFDVIRRTPKIPKNGWNEQGKYWFRKAEDIIASVGPIFNSERVIVIPEVICQDSHWEHVDTKVWTYVTVRYRFMHVDDQSFIDVLARGEGTDRSDKGINKAMTGAFKNALVQLLMIEDGEDSEADQTDGNGSQKPKGQNGNKSAPKGQADPQRRADPPKSNTAQSERSQGQSKEKADPSLMDHTARKYAVPDDLSRFTRPELEFLYKNARHFEDNDAMDRIQAEAEGRKNQPF